MSFAILDKNKDKKLEHDNQRFGFILIIFNYDFCDITKNLKV